MKKGVTTLAIALTGLLIALAIFVWFSPALNIDSKIGFISNPLHSRQLFDSGKSGKIGKLVAVFAHPDDEVMSAGLLKTLTSQGTEVLLMTLTDGRANSKSIASACLEQDMFACRKRELLESAKILGISKIETPGFPDSQLHAHINQAADFVQSNLRAFAPNALLTVEPSGLNGQTDHRATFRVVSLALERMKARKSEHIEAPKLTVFLSTLPFPLNLVLRTQMPPQTRHKVSSLQLSPALTDTKVAVAKAHPSQQSTLDGISGGLGVRPLFEWMNLESYYVMTEDEITGVNSQL